MIKRKDDFRIVYNEHMKGGDGTAKIIHYAEKEEIGGKCRLLAKIVLEPGCSIGEHTHVDEEEIFYIAKGSTAYYDNGTWVTLNEGDSAICLGGQTHSIANRGEETAEVIATVLLYQ
ncbi:MAG: cupin domain-containing protein [Clostridia bacterium]|nr:cupin domain-containing protein [Clostridia bacterium]